MCILLFFKVWGMTNDVKHIKYAIENNEPFVSLPRKVVSLKMLGKEKEAYDLIISRMELKLKTITANLNDRNALKCQEEWNKALNGYEALFKFIGYSLPQDYQVFNFENLSKFSNDILRSVR